MYDFVMPQFNVLGHEFYNITVTRGIGIDNLLGRNVIDCFDWFLSFPIHKLYYRCVGVNGGGLKPMTASGKEEDFSVLSSMNTDNLSDIF